MWFFEKWYFEIAKLWFCEIAKIVILWNCENCENSQFGKVSKLVIRKNSNWLIPELNSQKDLLTSLNPLLMVFSNHWWTKKWISEIFLKNWTRPWTIWCQWPNFTISCAFHRFRYILELNQPLEHFFYFSEPFDMGLNSLCLQLLCIFLQKVLRSPSHKP